MSRREEILESLRNAGSLPVVSGFPEGLLVAFDTELRFLCVGGEGMEALGLEPARMVGASIFEAFTPDVASALDGPYRRVLEGETISTRVHVRERTFVHRFAPYRDDGGAVVAGIGFVLDVTSEHQTHQKLRASQALLEVEERRLRDAELVGHSGSWEWDVLTGVITWSDGLFALHGIGPTTMDGGYDQAASRVHPEDRERVDEAMEQARRGEVAQFRYRVRRAGDGEMRWLDSRATGVFEDGTLVRLAGAVADVTDRVVAEAEVLESNSFLRAVLTASPDYTFITDVRTGAAVFGSRDRALMGYAADHPLSLGTGIIDALVHEDDQEALRALNAEAGGLNDGEVRSIRYRLRQPDGEWHWFSRHVVPFRRDDAGRVSEVLGVLRDIDDLVRAEEQLAHDALHDHLTGLPNRALLLDRVDAALIRCARESRTVAVLYCDLDGFKLVNDTAGHGAGDAVLVEAAARFSTALREGDTVARVGGDEFVLVIEPWNRQGAVPPAPVEEGEERSLGWEVAQRVIRAMDEPFFVGDREFRVTVSIGVVHLSPTSPAGARSAQLAIEEADSAMYVAKAQGKNRVFVAGASVHESQRPPFA